MLKSYSDLIVYQRSYGLCLKIYHVTKEFPKYELFGMVSQMRRAAASIPSNIAEGYSRRNRKEYLHFLRIALGSCAELDTFASLSIDLKYITGSKGQEITEELSTVGRLLSKLISSLEK